MRIARTKFSARLIRLVNRSLKLTVCVLFAAALGLAGCEKPVALDPDFPPEGALGELRTLDVDLAYERVTLEVAITQREQEQGLMYREALPENRGMLFVYAEPHFMSFWMKNTRIPLSIAFIRQDGIVSDVLKMTPHTGPFDPETHYRSTYQCQYALEMNQGWFESHGINKGDKLDLPYEQILKMTQDVLAR